MEVSTEKTCTKCGEVKVLAQFGRYSRNSKMFVNSQCKECVCARSRAWYLANRERHHANSRRWAASNPEKRTEVRRTTQLRKYGLTLADYAELWDSQGGRCASCFDELVPGRQTHVDHDHSCCPGQYSCGKCVRGLLCEGCNRGLGYFKDCPEKLEYAAEYIRRYRQWKIGEASRLMAVRGTN